MRVDGEIMGMEDTPEESAPETHGELETEDQQSVQVNVAIKGTRNGLLLTLEPGTPFGELLNSLAERLAEAPSFFRGASLALDTSRRSLHGNERMQLETLLAHYQMSVMPLETAMAARKDNGSAAFQPVNITSLTQPTSNGAQLAASRDPRESDDTLFLRRTVRSGQAIHHHSNIIVMGDVNPGAEIIAGGDIIVWGVLRGMVHAGYPDNTKAVVCSLLLAPVQLRIAHLLSRPPDGVEAQPRPEVASIRDEQIVVEAWVNGRAFRK
jgi:septum site-determining protein MinC